MDVETPSSYFFIRHNVEPVVGTCDQKLPTSCYPRSKLSGFVAAGVREATRNMLSTNFSPSG